jgi:hypothetical protein
LNKTIKFRTLPRQRLNVGHYVLVKKPLSHGFVIFATVANVDESFESSCSAQHHGVAAALEVEYWQGTLIKTSWKFIF